MLKHGRSSVVRRFGATVLNYQLVYPFVVVGVVPMGQVINAVVSVRLVWRSRTLRRTDLMFLPRSSMVVKREGLSNGLPN